MTLICTRVLRRRLLRSWVSLSSWKSMRRSLEAFLTITTHSRLLEKEEQIICNPPISQCVLKWIKWNQGSVNHPLIPQSGSFQCNWPYVRQKQRREAQWKFFVWWTMWIVSSKLCAVRWAMWMSLPKDHWLGKDWCCNCLVGWTEMWSVDICQSELLQSKWPWVADERSSY